MRKPAVSIASVINQVFRYFTCCIRARVDITSKSFWQRHKGVKFLLQLDEFKCNYCWYNTWSGCKYFETME